MLFYKKVKIHALKKDVKEIKTSPKYIRVPVSDEEYTDIKARSENNGMSMAKFMRHMALQGYVIHRGVVDIQRLVWEINKIGVNINQVVHLINQSKQVTSYQLTKIQDQHNEVWELIDKFAEPLSVSWSNGGKYSVHLVPSKDE